MAVNFGRAVGKLKCSVRVDWSQVKRIKEEYTASYFILFFILVLVFTILAYLVKIIFKSC